MNYTREQTTQYRWHYTPFQFVHQLIDVVEGGLLQNGDGFNGVTHALTGAIMRQIQ
jgi:hypothetical protein